MPPFYALNQQTEQIKGESYPSEWFMRGIEGLFLVWLSADIFLPDLFGPWSVGYQNVEAAASYKPFARCIIPKPIAPGALSLLQRMLLR